LWSEEAREFETGVKEGMNVVVQTAVKPVAYKTTHRRRAALAFSRSSNQPAGVKG
jgi:hypothetical protein